MALITIILQVNIKNILLLLFKIYVLINKKICKVSVKSLLFGCIGFISLRLTVVFKMREVKIFNHYFYFNAFKMMCVEAL